MAKGKPKKPKISTAATLSTAKMPRADIPVDFYKLKPAWRISRMEMCDPYGWHELGKEKLSEIRTKLGNFESMTWKEILVDANKQNHFIAVNRLSEDAQNRLQALRLDVIEDVVSLHLTGTERVFGINQGGVIMLLWWDPEHKVCPAPLKNT